MTITYRVLVIRQDAPRRANMLSSAMVEAAPEVLFEAAGPDAGRLLAFAPDEVAAALNAVGFAEASRKATGLVDVEALAAVVAVTEGGGITVEGAPPAAAVQAVDEPAAPKPPRRRRTKAEIAADEAAAKLAAQQQAPTDVTQTVEGGGEGIRTFAVPAAEAQPVDEPAPEQHVEPAPAPAPVAAAPAVPYNPFA